MSARAAAPWTMAMVLAIALLHFLCLFRLADVIIGYPDEEITAGVSAHIRIHGTLDTNWRHVPEISRHYPGDQFNFSAAILAAQPIASIAAHVMPGRMDASERPPLRIASAAYTAAAIVVFFLAFRLLFGAPAALLGTVLTAGSSQLFLDAHYARPEGFILFCHALALYAVLRAQAPSRRTQWLLVAGIACGLLIATKVSLLYVAAHLALVFTVLRMEQVGAKNPGKSIPWPVALGAGIAVGFGIGVPAAVADPLAYLRGVGALADQYSGAHLPFGRPFSSWPERAAFAIREMAAMQGAPQLLLAVVGAGLWIASRPRLAAAVVLPAAIFIAAFSIRPVFFERNIALYLPLVAALCGYALVEMVRRLPWQRLRAWVVPAMAGAVAASAFATFWRIAFEVLPLEVARTNETLRREVALSASFGVPIASWPYVAPDRVTPLAAAAESDAPKIYRVMDLGDPFSVEAADWLVRARGWRSIAYEPSALADLREPLVRHHHARAYRYVVPPHAPQPATRDFVDLGGLCAVESIPLAFEGESVGGVHASVPAAPHIEPGRGSWRGSDEWVGEVRTQPFTPVPGSFLPIVTGPDGGGVSAEIRDASSGRVLAQLPSLPLPQWIAWRLPSTDRPVVVVLRDDGNRWGQWIGIAGALLRVSGGGCPGKP
jgi:hypothetical protein